MEKRNFNADFLTYKDAYIKFKEYLLEGKSIADLAYCYDLTIERVNNILVRFDEVIDPIVYKAIREHYSQFTIDDNKAVVISDTHVGSHNEFLKLFDTIFNYCSKYGINNIIHAGDLVEGYSYEPNRKDEAEDQIIKLRSIFEKNNSFKMYYLYGNHDYNLGIYNHIELKEKLQDLKNLIYIGKGNSYIQLNDYDPINIVHTLSFDETYIPKIETNLRLEGHHHFYEFYDNGIVHLPALSYVNRATNLGFVKLETTGNEFILDVFKGLNKNNILEYCEQKVLKKICK